MNWPINGVLWRHVMGFSLELGLCSIMMFFDKTESILKIPSSLRSVYPFTER